MPSNQKVVIVGAGIGGLTAALAALKRGLDVEVYEQASELKEVGAGIQISSNGTRVLYALGLENALKRVQVLPSKRQIRHWSTGETWNWFDLGTVTQQRYGTPHVMLHRGDLHGLLADAVRALKPDAVKLGKRCAAVAIAPDHAEVKFEDGETVRAAYVIGADGIHSRVRQELFGAGQAGVHRLRRLARPGADGEAAAAHRADAGHQLARPARPRAALSGAARRDHELHHASSSATTGRWNPG